MKKGDKVKWAKPENDHEAAQRMILDDDPATYADNERVEVVVISSLPFAQRMRCYKHDIVLAEQKGD